MSLVVARASSFGVQMIADTRVIDPSTRTPSPTAGTLKLVVTDPLLCVAYAGRVDVATTAIRELLRGSIRDRSLENASRRLLAAHVASDGATDFLIGALHAGPLLLRVSEGRIEEGTSFWLGSQAAQAREGQRHRSLWTDHAGVSRSQFWDVLAGRKSPTLRWPARCRRTGHRRVRAPGARSEVSVPGDARDM